MAVNIGPKIGVDGEAEYRKEMNNIIQQAKTLSSEMKAVTSSFSKNDSEQKKLTAQTQVLNKQIEVQQKRVDKLAEMYQKSAQKLGENDTKTLKWKQALNEATAELRRMEKSLDDVGDGMDDMGSAAQTSTSGISAMAVTIGNLAAQAIGTAIGAIKDFATSIWNLDETTEEFRRAQGRLNTAFEAAGYGADTAQEAYTGFYKILGDTDTATEASQLLAQLA